MISKAFETALNIDLPVLFAYIGWTNKHNGTEPVLGGHSGYLKAHRRENSEVRAFVQEEDGSAVEWQLPPAPIHIVFVARDPRTQTKKIVGVYAKATVEKPQKWAQAQTHYAVLIPVDRRPKLSVEWPEGQGMRRWAKCDGSRSYSKLLRVFPTV